ncbi:hypothetical protein V2I93_11335 [Pseudomonas viridiflava]|uniref:hypothetical protein n=1 Tax=Pseudomonas viridiflava TaxID=33069 RepID=UPI0018E5E995|nr:hypothetical protein [Pseudomonas viridiflava]MBI6577513.1 hypothetical protein [Pseudomonas viridiflava]MBI6608701.1 hypothetical protein [Pseudomonas viridiflava]MBI6641213.1 hypothetical protein [Pseudomonas viridiflava]MBI6866539.1 hypothetical protein [Pseudomonas viridiflava]MEE4103917.1 hypothetical protein [Pseudomonas viridiflava]
MSGYEIVFDGRLVEGAQLERVKANLGKLFQADESRLELLFSGRRLVLKNNLDEQTAEKYRATLERAGAVARVVMMKPAVPQPEQAAQPLVTVPAAEAQEMEEVELARPPDEPTWLRKTSVRPGRLQIKPRDAYMAAFSDVDAPDYSVAEAGSDMQDPKPAPVVPQLDLSRLSVAPVGSDMGQVPRANTRPVPDTSHLKLD